MDIRPRIVHQKSSVTWKDVRKSDIIGSCTSFHRLNLKSLAQNLQLNQREFFSAAVHPCSLPAKQTSYFMTLPVRVSSKDKDILTYALLDSESQRTFCERDLASELGAQGPRQILSLQTLSSGSCSDDTVEGELVSLSVQKFDSDSESFQLKDVFTVESIPVRAAQKPDKEGFSKLEYLRGAKFGEISDK